jgi:hypothetical protein
MGKLDKPPYEIGDMVITKIREHPANYYVAKYVDEMVEYGGREAIITGIKDSPLGFMYTFDDIPGYWSLDMLEKCPNDFDPTKIL